MTVICDVTDCIYNINGVICSRTPCLISKGLCEWVYLKKNNYNLNPSYQIQQKEGNNNEQEKI